MLSLSQEDINAIADAVVMRLRHEEDERLEAEAGARLKTPQQVKAEYRAKLKLERDQKKASKLKL